LEREYSFDSKARGNGRAQKLGEQYDSDARDSEDRQAKIVFSEQPVKVQIRKRSQLPDVFLVGREIAEQASGNPHGSEQRHGKHLTIEHRRDGDQDAGQQSGGIASQQAHYKAALETQVEGAVGFRGHQTGGDHSGPNSGCVDRRADQGHFQALREGAFFAHQHALEGSRTGQDTGERSSHGQFDQQDNYEGLHAGGLPTIIMEILPAKTEIRKVAEADFPSRFGHFRIHGFERDAEEAVVLAMGDLKSGDPPLVRIHSQCLTGDVFHSLRCDCRAQLELALEAIGAEGRGLLIYLNQEGRGIGLLNKLRAYELQDQGADTVEANEQLGFEADLRAYALPGAILAHFGLRSVRLMSNNPQKIEALETAGITVAERIPVIAAPMDTTADYLRTKREKMGHLLDLP